MAESDSICFGTLKAAYEYQANKQMHRLAVTFPKSNLFPLSPPALHLLYSQHSHLLCTAALSLSVNHKTGLYHACIKTDTMLGKHFIAQHKSTVCYPYDIKVTQHLERLCMGTVSNSTGKVACSIT
jgi:hypothetical protein